MSIKHLVIPDTQVKPGVPLDHFTALGNYIVEKQPDVIVHIGDHWDMPSLSSYDEGKAGFDQRDYQADIDSGNEAMRCRKTKHKIILILLSYAANLRVIKHTV